MSDDAELNELERFEALVRGPGWVPDIDKGADYEEWTGKWYTPTRPDGTGGWSLALYGDDEELLLAKYIAALRNAAPRLIRAARHLAAFDKDGLVAENEALRRRLCEVERERDEQRERAEAGTETVAEAFDLADKYHKKRGELRITLGARWNESLEDAAARLSIEAGRENIIAGSEMWKRVGELEKQIPIYGRLYTLAGIAYGGGFDAIAEHLRAYAAALATNDARHGDAVSAIRSHAESGPGPERWFWRAAVRVIDSVKDACVAGPQAPGHTPPV